MARQIDVKGPRFVRYFGPVIDVLKSLGGSGSPEEVRAAVASRLAISEEEQSEQLASGSSRFDNQVAWARFYLTRAGLLDSSGRGIWTLTEKGRSTTLSDAAALQLFKDIHNQFSVERRAAQFPRCWPMCFSTNWIRRGGCTAVISGYWCGTVTIW